jgi:hypothetical protein
MDTLEEGQWLNDNIMSFYMEYMERQVIPIETSDVLLLRPTMSQLIAHTPGKWSFYREDLTVVMIHGSLFLSSPLLLQVTQRIL